MALMGTIVELDVCYDSADEEKLAPAFKQVWDRLKDIAWRMSVFEENTEVWRINHSFQNPVQVSEDTYQVIKLAKMYNGETFGTFDISVYPLILMWRQMAQEDRLPSRSELKAAKEDVGIENIRLHGDNTVEVLSDRASIDLGGIAKGYAIDEAARIFKENGFNNFMVDAGGDLYVGGHNCQKRPWRIGIKDPRNPKEILKIVAVSDVAIATSGDYERFFEIQGQKYSHIINPVTGYPQKGVVSATVIAPSATEADVYATALCVLDDDMGVRMINDKGEGWASLVMVQKRGRFFQYPSKRYSKLRAGRLR